MNAVETVMQKGEAALAPAQGKADILIEKEDAP